MAKAKPLEVQVLEHLRRLQSAAIAIAPADRSGVLQDRVFRASGILYRSDLLGAVEMLRELCEASDEAIRSGRAGRRSESAQAEYDRSKALIQQAEILLQKKTKETMNTNTTDPLQAGAADSVTGPISISHAEAHQLGPREVDLALIDPNPHQPRKYFDLQKLLDLANRIHVEGMLQRPIVRPVPVVEEATSATCYRFSLIAGERRLRAVKLLRERGDWEGTIKVEVVLADDVAALEMAISENLDREDINPIEEAAALAELEKMGRTQAQIGERFGKSQGAVSNAIRLLNLPDAPRNMIEQGTLSPGHGVALLSLKTPEERRQFAQEASREGLSVAALRERINTHKDTLALAAAPALPLVENEGQSGRGEDTVPETEGEAQVLEAPPDEETDHAEQEASQLAEPAASAPGGSDIAEGARSTPRPVAPLPSEPLSRPDVPEPTAEEEPEAEHVLVASTRTIPVDFCTPEPQEESDVEDEAPEVEAAEPSAVEVPGAEDAGAPGVVEPVSGAVSEPEAGRSQLQALAFTGPLKPLVGALPSDAEEWLKKLAGNVNVALRASVLGYARLHAFADALDWTPEQVLDAIEGRDLGALETLLARLAELAAEVHDG